MNGPFSTAIYAINGKAQVALTGPRLQERTVKVPEGIFLAMDVDVDIY